MGVISTGIRLPTASLKCHSVGVILTANLLGRCYPLNRIRVRVPATTANLGPGFDCLGLALDLYNTVAVETGQSFSISITGEGAQALDRSPKNLVYRAMAAVYERIGRPVPPCRLSCHNEIPLRRGLGSSAAAAAGGLVTANLLCGQPLPTEELIRLGTALEGHPDNIAPAILGGCQIAVLEGGKVITAAVSWPQALKAVLFIPDFEMATAQARSILPPQVSRADAIYNISRTALLVTALTTGRFEHLRVATQDRLHQPARQAIFPAMSAIFEAALAAGALGAFLSGGGSTILALAVDKAEAIAEAMARAAQGAGVTGRTRLARASALGAHPVIEATAKDSVSP